MLIAFSILFAIISVFFYMKDDDRNGDFTIKLAMFFLLLAIATK